MLQRVIFEIDAKVVVDVVTSLEDDDLEFEDIMGCTCCILFYHAFFSIKVNKRQANWVAQLLLNCSDLIIVLFRVLIYSLLCLFV